MTFYSQHGEDFLLDKLFEGQNSGFFVEVGCIDGQRFSNTLIFEERGWKGLCVEAHSGYIEMMKKNRPGSIICHCAAAEADEDDAVFYANSRGSLSTLDPTKEDEFRRDYGKYFTGFEKQVVRKRRLDSVFKEHGITNIDLLSIDIEGYEVQALKGIDFKVFKPAVIVVEASEANEEAQIRNILGEYHFLCRLSNNLFFARDKNLRSRVAGQIFPNVVVTHTKHPCDEGEDKQVTWTIDTREPVEKESKPVQKEEKSVLGQLASKLFQRPK